MNDINENILLTVNKALRTALLTRIHISYVVMVWFVLEEAAECQECIQSKLLQKTLRQYVIPNAKNTRTDAEHMHQWCCNKDSYPHPQKFMQDLIAD